MTFERLLGCGIDTDLLQWLFLIEGIVTGVVGVASWILMPASPCQTASRFRGKNGWFTEHEEKILVNRLLRDDPSKGDMHNRQAVGLQRLWKCLKDYDLWPLYLIGLTNYIPPSPPSNYLAFILRQMGFSTFNANLLTIPSQFLFGVNLLIISRISEWVNERSLVSSTSAIWIFPWLVALVTLGAKASNWVRYALLTGLLSYPYCHAILVAWNSRNSNAVRTRAVSAALYNMFVQAGNIVGSNIYRDSDRPLCKFFRPLGFELPSNCVSRSTWKQDSSRHLLFQHRTIFLRQVLLYHTQ